MTLSPDVLRRRAAMTVVAEASGGELSALIESLDGLPPVEDLRRPEIGMVMLRGRMGGDGNAFNLGEVTVTRAAVRTGTGTVGFGYVLGRDRDKARAAALIDALIQEGTHAAPLSAGLERLADAQAEARVRRAEEVAATRVDFFTVARGED